MRISDWSSDVCSSDLEAARKLGFSASHTMRIAQGLYEDGAITYMRTDGVQMDGSAISAARVAVANRYDASYVPDKPRQYQTKARNAQEAHEAIRPTDFGKDRAGSGDHSRLYDLIWKRALRSEEHTSELQSLMRISYAVFCLKKKKHNTMQQ